MNQSAPARSAASSAGFTLVELLVVVAILGLLLSLLMPSLAAARRQTQELVCRSNLRNIFTGVLMYTQDHDSHVPLVEPLRLPEEPGIPPGGSGFDPALQASAYDPFDARRPQAVGTVLSGYVEPGSWRCPSAIAGYPEHAGRGRWTLTYSFRTAQRDQDGALLPFTDAGMTFLGQGGVVDPLISNYAQLDGRPLRYFNGRRFVFFASGGGQPMANYNYDPKTQRYWAVRWPLIWDTLAGEPGVGMPRYPHHGHLEPRPDLAEAEVQFKTNTHYDTARTGYVALFADADQTETLLTRDPIPHRPSY